MIINSHRGVIMLGVQLLIMLGVCGPHDYFDHVSQTGINRVGQ